MALLLCLLIVSSKCEWTLARSVLVTVVVKVILLVNLPPLVHFGSSTHVYFYGFSLLRVLLVVNLLVRVVN